VTCIYTPQSLEAMGKMIEDCAAAVGGSNWLEDATIGLGTIVVAMFLISTLFWLLRQVAR
jgi:hypothetical protein